MKERLCFLTVAAVMLAGAQTQNVPSGPALFTLWGSGIGTDGATGGNIQGVSQTNLIGAATFVYTFVNGKNLGTNAGGLGTCSLQSGTLEVATIQGTISMTQAGTSCNVNGGMGPNTVTGTYLITQGSGKFQGITGTGTVVVSFSSTATPGKCLIRLDGLLLAP